VDLVLQNIKALTFVKQMSSLTLWRKTNYKITITLKTKDSEKYLDRRGNGLAINLRYYMPKNVFDV
jgi:hypothetical protein